MSMKKIEKGKEFRPRLHDGTDKMTQLGRFVILKLDTEDDAKRMATQAVYIRPNRKKGPVRIA